VETTEIIDAICYDPETVDRVELVGRITTADGLMLLLDAYNWNDGYDVPTAIALHPAADLAVALNLYWLASADEWFGNPEPPEEEYELQNFAFGRMMTERILSGCYSVGTTSYDPGFNRVALYHLRKGNFPEVLYTPVVGKATAP